MSREVRIQTRVGEATSDALEEYVDEHDFTKSEVIRSAVRLQLAREGLDVPVADGGTLPDRDVEQKLEQLEQRLEEDDPTTRVFLLNVSSVTAAGAIAAGVAAIVGVVATGAAVLTGLVLLAVSVAALLAAAAGDL